MKRSKIIFSMVFMTMLLSTAIMAQTRVVISTGIIPPYGYPPIGYGYAPQPVYYPPYIAPYGYYRQPYGHPHHAYYNDHYGNGGYGYGNRNGRENRPRHY